MRHRERLRPIPCPHLHARRRLPAHGKRRKLGADVILTRRGFGYSLAGT